jgi:hypothetical protein
MALLSRKGIFRRQGAIRVLHLKLVSGLNFIPGFFATSREAGLAESFETFFCRCPVSSNCAPGSKFSPITISFFPLTVAPVECVYPILKVRKAYLSESVEVRVESQVQILPIARGQITNDNHRHYVKAVGCRFGQE